MSITSLSCRLLRKCVVSCVGSIALALYPSHADSDWVYLTSPTLKVGLSSSGRFASLYRYTGMPGGEWNGNWLSVADVGQSVFGITDGVSQGSSTVNWSWPVKLNDKQDPVSGKWYTSAISVGYVNVDGFNTSSLILARVVALQLGPADPRVFVALGIADKNGGLSPTYRYSYLDSYNFFDNTLADVDVKYDWTPWAPLSVREFNWDESETVFLYADIRSSAFPFGYVTGGSPYAIQNPWEVIAGGPTDPDDPNLDLDRIAFSFGGDDLEHAPGELGAVNWKMYSLALGRQYNPTAEEDARNAMYDYEPPPIWIFDIPEPKHTWAAFVLAAALPMIMKRLRRKEVSSHKRQ